MKPNRNHIELKFFDFDISHKEISKLIDLEPTHKWYKDEEYVVGSNIKPVLMWRKDNYWGYEILTETTGYIGDQIEEFLIKIISPRINAIRELGEKYHGEFSIVQYIYEGCNPGFFLEKNQLAIINECHLGLNVDFYVLSGIEDIIP